MKLMQIDEKESIISCVPDSLITHIYKSQLLNDIAFKPLESMFLKSQRCNEKFMHHLPL